MFDALPSIAPDHPWGYVPATTGTEARFRTVIETILGAFVLFGADGTVLHVAPSSARLLGYEPDELAAMGGFKSLHPNDRDRLGQAFATRLTAPGDDFVELYRARHKDGGWRWLEARAVNLLHEATIGAVVITYRDVTSQREIRDALRAAMEGSLDAIYILTCDRGSDGQVADFLIADVNRNGADLVAMSRAQILGRRLCEVLPVNRTGGFLERYVRVVETGETLEEDFPITTADGRRLWLHHQVVRAGDGVVITTRDVTARKQAEETLRAREELLRTVIANIPCGMFWKDRASAYLGCNDLFARDHGLSGPELVVGRTDLDMSATALEAEYFRACDRRVIETGEPLLGFEERLTRADGSQAVLLTSKVPLRGAAGAVVGVLGLYQDITDRKRAENEVGAWRDRYEAAVKSTGQMLYDWDSATDHVTWAGSCESTLGYREPEMPPDVTGWRDLVHPDDRAAFDREADRSLSSGTPFRLEYRVRRRDGTFIIVSDHGHFLPARDGRPSRQIGFVADVTDRKRLEDQFRQAQKMEAVGQLAGGVAHDFNNLLTVINGYANIMLKGIDKNDPSRPMIEEVKQAGERAADLTRQLLAFGRKQILQPKVLDLNAAVADVGQMIQRLIGEDVKLVLRLHPHLLSVLADRGQVGQVLMNLAVNARDAMPTGGTLCVETDNATLGTGTTGDGAEVHSGRYVRLSVTDTGTGMTEEVRGHIFEPFFTTKEQGKGTGLGLATVYGIVKQSGGHIEVESAPGRGTAFRVYLPALAASATPKEASDETAPKGGETVLLVEDETGVRKLAQLILRQQGYSVLTAAGAAEASAIATRGEQTIDLLLTDVVMPGASGRVLAEQLRAGNPRLKVLFMSGYTGDAVVRHGIATEQVNFVQKPFTPTSLARKVREVLDACSDDALI